MAQKGKRFGLGKSFEDLCETNELSITHLKQIVQALSTEELNALGDDFALSINDFISKYESSSFNSLDELLQSSLQHYTTNFQPKPSNSPHLFDGLESLLND